MSTFFIATTRAFNDLNLAAGAKAELYFNDFELVKAQATKDVSNEVVRGVGHGIEFSYCGEQVQTEFYMFG